jgi:hypothetical protein
MRQLVASAALWLGDASHHFAGVFTAAGPRDFATGITGCRTAHFYLLYFQKTCDKHTPGGIFVLPAGQ